MIKKIILACFVSVIWLFSSTAQNSIWICAPKLLKPGQFQQNLPITSSPTNNPVDPFDYYDGWSALHGSNGISDVVTGALKFFIIDGAIYAGNNGEYKDYAWSASQPNVLQVGNFYQPEGDGGSEQLIIPHPKNCNQYYIFGVYTYWDGDSGLKTLPGYASSMPVYALYDADLGQVINRGVWYSPTPSYIPTSLSNPIFTTQTTTLPVNTNGDSPMNATTWADDCSMSTAAIASTKLLSDGSRIIACKMKNNLYSIKILPDGTLRYWKRYNHSSLTAGSQTRAEFELVFDDATSKFKLAFESRNSAGSNYTYCIKYMELSSNFLTQTNFQTINIPAVGGSSSAVKPVAGIEFSPNKSLIYLTCGTNEPAALPQPVSQRIYTINLANSTYPISSFAISQAIQDKIQYGHIEMALDGNMYFASATGLFRLTNPNTPTVGNFSLTPTIAFTYLTNLGINSLGSILVDNKYLFGHTLPGQIDGANYTTESNANVECCFLNAPYQIDTYTANTSATWSNGQSLNPFNVTNGVILVKNSLIIPAGKDITISGMTLKFAPGARIIVQEGYTFLNTTIQGGKLTLNNCLLTDLAECSDTMWHGIEVWGNDALTQGSIASSAQGRLITQGNTIIQNSLHGVAARATDPVSGAVVSGKFGGIIQATNTTFLNNQNDAYILNYNSGASNNLSRFTNCVFQTSSLLNNAGLQLGNHITLTNVRGVFIQGCDFKNTAMQLFAVSKQGIGIYGTNAGFTVEKRCTNPTTGCIPDDPNTFTNLTYGIYNYTVGSNMNFKSDGNIFDNNAIGIFATGTRLQQIVRNTFKVRELLSTNPIINQSSGIYLVSSSGYKIEENSFSYSNNASIPDNQANSYGIVVNNSGTEENVIYRNTFSNLKIGGQSELTNGSAPIQFPSPSNLGLVWKCNEFETNIYSHDITSINGRIKYRQGFTNPAQNPYQNQFNAANNRFSMHDETLPEHDFKISPSTTLQYSIVYTGYNQPYYDLDQFTSSLITEANLTNTFRANTCPSNYTYDTIVLRENPIEENPIEEPEGIEVSQLSNDEVSDLSNEIAIIELGNQLLERNNALQEILLDPAIEDKNAIINEYLSQFEDESSMKMALEFQLESANIDSVIQSVQNKNEAITFNESYIQLLKIKAELIKSSDYFAFLTNKEHADTYLKTLHEIAANEENELEALEAKRILLLAEPLDLVYHFLEVDNEDTKNMKINSDESNDLIVYPNPVDNTLSINLQLSENELVSATVFSILGNEVGSYTLSNETKSINASHLQAGIYIIRLRKSNGDVIQSLRFVKR